MTRVPQDDDVGTAVAAVEPSSVPQVAAGTTERKRAKLVLASVSLLLFVSLIWSSRAGSLDDYGVLYSAGRVVLKGQGCRLYNHNINSVEYATIGKTRPGAFIYPPFLALVFVPLAMLPYGISYAVWGALNLLCLGAVVRLLRPYTIGFNTEDRLAVIAMVFFPIRCALLLGQASILLLLLLTAALVSLRNRREFKAGSFIGLSLFRPQLIVPLALMLAVKRKWKALAGLAVTGLFLGGVSLLLAGWAGCASFVSHASHSAGRFEAYVDLTRMPNLRGLMIFLFGSAHATLPVTASSAALLIWCAKRWSDSGSIERSFSLAVLASLLTAYYSWLYDLDLLLLTSILCVSRGRKLIALGLTFFCAELVILAVPSKNLPFCLLAPIMIAWACYVLVQRSPTERVVA